MAKFSTRPHNSPFLPHPTNPRSSIFHSVSPTRLISQSHLLRLSLRVCCSIKEKENVKGNEEIPPVLSGLRVDASERTRSISKSENDLSSGNGIDEVGFDSNWPPWRNVPDRYKLIGTTALAFVICNMDKVNLSVAIIPMSHQFGWNSSVAGLVQSSFFWGYALSQLPGGWLAKIFGGRKVLEIGVLTWSLATALVPFLAGYMPGLIFSRILVGIGEGVSPSAATDLIARSIPLQERSRAVAFVFGGLSVGSVSGLLLAPSLIQNFGWESVFYIFGFLGIAWFAGFQFLDGQPSVPLKSISAVSESESESGFPTKKSTKPFKLQQLPAALKEVPWRGFLEYPPVWAMIYTHFCGSWGHYTCLSWLPTYFSEELNLNLTEAAWVSILPPLASIFVTSVASQLADNLISNGVDTTAVRKICQTIAFVSPAVCMTLSSVDLGLPPWEVVGILTSGLALSSFALSGLYCTHQDMSPEYASVLLGITNTVGAIPGIVGVALTGFLLDSTHSWSISLFAPSIFFYLTGTIVWLVFASSKPKNFSKNE
ncbi:probable anion transporter 6, chloroplastic [Benincasa hispida]|uniref:probable anion transporter 6, chloroplastic n=1 Tax=Benincasa hispida TaxID=102211 RepID=UPI001901D8C4|nr:probable anion transporter 6, chloroplastic [Benincasa hispida]